MLDSFVLIEPRNDWIWEEDWLQIQSALAGCFYKEFAKFHVIVDGVLHKQSINFIFSKNSSDDPSLPV